jgi:hypothetical protein
VIPLQGDFESPLVYPYVDNIQVDPFTGITRNWLVNEATPDTFALPMDYLNADNFASPFVGVIDEIVLHSKTLLAADIDKHYRIVIGKYLEGQTAGQRAATLLDMGLWMSDGRDIGVTSTTVQAIETAGKTLLDALKECEEAEQGRLFIAPDGRVRFIGRQAIQTETAFNTPQRVYGDGSGELQYSEIEFAYNDRLIANRVTVSRNSGGPSTANDVVSQGEYFIRAKDISNLITNQDGFVRDLAAAQVATYKQPELRVESLRLNPRGNPAGLYPAVLGDDFGTRVTVVRRPQSVGSAISKSLILEGVEHQIGADQWSTNYSFSPIPPDYFVLDSLTFGVLDVNVLGY